MIVAVRNLRAEHQVKPSQKIKAKVLCKEARMQNIFEENKEPIMRLAGIGELKKCDAEERPGRCMTLVTKKATLFVPFEELFDVEQEKKRLIKEIEKAEQDRNGIKKKLENENFVSRAPKEIVEMEQGRLLEKEGYLKKVQQAFQQLK